MVENLHEFSPESLEFKIARLKIPVVLYGFHALQYPEQHPDIGTYTVEDLNDYESITFDEVGLEYDLPERFVKDPNRSVGEKSEWFCQQFKHIARVVLSVGSVSGVALTAEVMHRGLEELVDSDALLDDDGDPVQASKIMPPEDVVQAMLRSSVARYKWFQRCRPLETFIGSVYRPDPEYPRYGVVSS